MHSYAVAMAKKEGMDDVVAKMRISHETQVKWYRNEIEIIKEWEKKELDLFMVKNKKIFLTTLENPDKQAIKTAIEKGGRLIPSLYEKSNYGGLGKNDDKCTTKKTFDPGVTDGKKIVSIVEKTIDDACVYAEEVAGVALTGTEEIFLQSSEGIKRRDDNSWVTLSTRAFASDDASGHAVACARNLRDLKRTAGREAGEIAAMAKNPEKGAEGTYTVMFSPLAFANILSHVAHASSAFSVDNGMSFLAGKLGDTIGSEQFTFIDTGLHPNGIASRAFDDEGLTTMETTIFEKGALNSYLHNTSTALNYKTQTTRNAGLISPMPWNSFVVPGEVTEKEMMEDMKAGIYVTNVWYTRFQNYLTGEFSTLPRDGIFQVKKGEISQPLKEVRISDNMCHLLSNIKALSSTHAQIYWWEVDVPTFTPYALINDVKITRPFA